MNVRSLLIALCLLVTSIALAGNQPYRTVSPKKGDGIITLLNRYFLGQNTCDIDHFYKINRLEKGSALFAHKMYKLPVFIYQYDNKSIRSTIDDNDWDKAVRIKEYNEKLKEAGIRSTHYTESKILWVPYSELQCDNDTQTKIIESKSENVLNVSFFGEDYQRVEIKDNDLKGHVYYIVSGHGGPDPGAMCETYKDRMCEDEYSYDIALRLARDLMQHGAKVHVIIQDKNDGIRDEKFLSCDRDELLLGKEKLPLDQLKRLNQRAAAINRIYRAEKKKGLNKHLAIFLHVDSNGANKEQDVYFYHHKKSKVGKKIAKKVLKTFNQKYDKYQKGRGYKGHISSRGLYVLNYTQPPALFIELGNIRNKDNHKRLLINSNRQALAKWIREGVSDL